MRRPPISVILSWPRPNYVDPDTRGDALLVVESIFLALSWIILSMRLYVRLFILRKTWYDDWIMVAAAVFLLIVGSLLCFHADSCLRYSQAA
jgi:hypothetical protein